jgi:hypothetical protein
VRTAIEDQEGVHFCAQVNVATGGRISSHEMHSAVGVDGDFAEKVYVGHQIHFAQSPLAKLDQELVASVSVKGVAVFLVS